jgi:hypothetical protein
VIVVMTMPAKRPRAPKSPAEFCCREILLIAVPLSVTHP